MKEASLQRSRAPYNFNGMNNVRSQLQALGLILALFAGLSTTPAGAVGIGQARVESFLGEPLRVRVAISFAPGETITGACVRIASPPGQESPFIPDLARASFQLIEGPRGAELVITTRRPYTDPILVFPLKVGCGEGGVYREITLLIDPPGMAAPARAARAQPAPPAPAPAQPRRVTRPSAPPPAAAPVTVEGGQWYVDRGETLSGIIVKSGLDGGDRKRRLELIDAVVAANPNVFRGRGPDYLPAGATLTLPGWAGSKGPGETPVLTETAAPEAAPPEPEVEQPTAAKEEDFRLKLTGEQPDGVIVTPEMKKLEEELARLNAASAEERQVNAELQDRLLQLKQQAAELQLVAEQLARESQERTANPGTPPPAEEGAPATTTPEPAPVMVEAPAGLPAPAAEPEIVTNPVTDSLNWLEENLLLVAAAVFVVLLLFAFLIRRGGRASDGPTLDELLAQKELEQQAQLDDVKETAHVAHKKMFARRDADSGDEPIPEADSSHYIFSVEEVDSLLEQAEVLLLFGEPAKAIEMIEEYLDGPGIGSREPRPWLKLFNLLRSEERRDEFEERAQMFKRQFNIEKPNWMTYAPGGIDSADIGLEEACPHIARRIEELWEVPGESLAYLDALLVDDRDGAREGFPRMIAEDLLVLRDLAREHRMAAA